MMLTPLSPLTLTLQAADTLRRFILSEEFGPGAELPSERELSESLAVSRNIVREALSTLVAEGMITKRAGRGVFVTGFDRPKALERVSPRIEADGHSLAELGDARFAVEAGAAGMMARNITVAQLAHLDEINARLADALANNRGGVRDDLAFHEVLLQSTANSVIISLIPLLVEHFRLMVQANPAVVAHNDPRIVTEHAAILKALRRRDSTAVRAMLTAHFVGRRFPL